MTCDWLASRSNIFRFNCALSSSTHESSKLPDIIFFDSAKHMSMTSCLTQRPWIQPYVNPKWIRWAATLNIIGFSNMLSSSTYESDEFSDPISWVQLRTKFKQTWNWWAARLNILGFSYTFSLNTNEPDELPGQSPLGSAMYWDQVHMSFANC